jgi:hypothetical protein
VNPTEAIFLLTVVAVAAAFVLGAASPAYTVLGLSAWLAFSAALAASGWMAGFSARPPHFLAFIMLTFAATIALAFSRVGASAADRLGFGALAGFQVFRVPVEWALFALHRDGVAPVQMSFEGWNFDVLTGLTAPLVAWLAVRGRIGRRGLLAWNCAGLALLANIVAIAALSTPTPLRVFWNEPANTFVATWPWVWLPAFLVPAALLGHLVSLRKIALLR